MTRRPRYPRYPLVRRLAWIEGELEDAATLLQMIISDGRVLASQLDSQETRLVLLVGVVTGAMVLLGIDPRLLSDFLDAMGPEGDVERAEALAAAISEQVFTLMAPDEGEGH